MTMFRGYFTPKLFIVLNEGYSFLKLRKDVIAGLTVSIIALPLAMALAIASGTTPDRGLYTAIVAGFLISFLGGSRYQIGGPTGAFVVVVSSVIHTYGYEGLVVATIMAGILLIFFGLARLGGIIKYIPFPVITGFTSGIAVILLSSQIKDFLGLTINEVPAEFVGKWVAYVSHMGSVNGYAAIVSMLCLSVIIILRKYKPSLPAYLIAITLGTVLVALTQWPVETIGSRFGDFPSTLPPPQFPSWGNIQALIPSAFTIAFLAGIESLLSAVVADGMTGRRHKSNCELIAQGIANIASVIMGGIPATGAIARTAANVKAGAESPLSGIFHAVFLFLFMVLLAPYAKMIPLSSLSAILVMVAWNMSEIERFRYFLTAPHSDRSILLMTFALTVLVDLTVAISVGIIVASLLFMRRMSQVTKMNHKTKDTKENEEAQTFETSLPEGVEAFEIIGPIFFGLSSRLSDVLDRIRIPPKVFILDMKNVPTIDATGVQILDLFIKRLRNKGVYVILCAVPSHTRTVIIQMGLEQEIAIVSSHQKALTIAREQAALGPT